MKEERDTSEKALSNLARIANTMRLDGYSNMLNKYGTSKDNSMYYEYHSEPYIDDMKMTDMYTGNGLFARIIDRPSEEAVKHGLDIDFGNDKIKDYVEDRLDELDFEEKFIQAESLARLYGGSLVVLVTNDGRALEEPFDSRLFKSLDEMLVFDRTVAQPDYKSMYKYGFSTAGSLVSRLGEPDFFDIFSVYGQFRVHRSRCLVFRNGRMPERVAMDQYRYWGIPELLRIQRAMRECMTSHTDGVKLMERSVQAIYKMKNLASMLATDEGENKVLQRLNVIDMARGILNSIAIDNDGEDYDFKNFSTTGVKDIIDATCNMLSAVSAIPQTILFGKSPAGENSTGESDFENYYNLVEKIQKQNMKKSCHTLIDLILKQGVIEGAIEKVPKYKVEFAPLWSMSDTEKAQVESTKAGTAMTKAQVASMYVSMQALDPSEVRNALKMDGELGFDINDNGDSLPPLNIPQDTFNFGQQGNDNPSVTPDELELAQAIEMESPKPNKDSVVAKNATTSEVGVVKNATTTDTDNTPTPEESIMAHTLNGTDETALPTANEMIMAEAMENSNKPPHINPRQIQNGRFTKRRKSSIININNQYNKDGGSGSGNFGHSGRVGEVGGSSSNGGDEYKPMDVNRFKVLLKNRAISDKINSKEQRKHYKGTNEYEYNMKRGKHKSELTIPEKEVQSIIRKKQFDSPIQYKGNSIRAFINCDKVVGKVFRRKDTQGTKGIDTKVLMVIYTRYGAHAVPTARNPSKGGNSGGGHYRLT